MNIVLGNLFVQCSEYVDHISLNSEEAEFVRKIIEKLSISSEEHIMEHFNASKVPDSPLDMREFVSGYSGPDTDEIYPSSFIEDDIVDDYEFLRDIVLKWRNGRSKDELYEAVVTIRGKDNGIS